MKPICTRTLGNAEIKVYVDLTNINDSMLLPSGTMIATFEDDEAEIYLSYEVQGEIDLWYKGERYRNPLEFPDELKELLNKGGYDDNADLQIDENNWFEGMFWDTKGCSGSCLNSDCIDIGGMTPEQIADDIIW